MRIAILNIDILNAFCPGGTLPVKDGDQVVVPSNIINKKAQQENHLSIFVADRHPQKTGHFKKWPPHAIKGTPDAEFHPLLNTEGGIIIEKGTKPDEDAYSGLKGLIY